MERKRKSMTLSQRLLLSHVAIMVDAVVLISVLARISVGDETHEILKLSLITGAVCFVFAFIASRMVGSHIERQIDKLRKFSRRVSEYDFSEDIVDETNNEFGEMLVLLNDTQVMIRDAVDKLKFEAGTMDSIGSELHDAADLAVGRLTKVVDTLDAADTMDKSQIKELYNELNAAVTYMEQMRTAAEQHTEIADKHKDRLNRFKIDEERQTS